MKKLPKNIVKKINKYSKNKDFNKKKKKKLISIVEDKYKKSLVSPGDAVGLITAQSMGEPGTQLTLRTKHYAGSLEVSVGSGIQRVIEIVDGRSSAKYPSMTIYLDKKKITNKKDAEKFCNSLIDIKIRDIGNFEEDFKNKKVTYVVDKEKAKNLKFNLKKIMEKIYDSIDSLYDSKRFSSNNTKINLNFDKDTDLYSIRKAIRKWNKRPVAGIKHIKKAVLNRENREYVINTKGTNLKKVLKLDEIDSYRVQTNDLFEIKKVFGIEAAREAIVKEYMKTMMDNSININIRHAYLLADIMTSEAEIKGVVRTGITGDKKSPFARASFEETIKHLVSAAFNRDVENLEGVVENIIVGQPISAGTGTVKLTIDPKGFKKMIKKQKNKK